MSFIGPPLPPHLRRLEQNNESVSPTTEEDTGDNQSHSYGPALPPHLRQAKKVDVLASESFGEDDDPSTIIGPLPPPTSGSKDKALQDSIAEQIDARSNKTKNEMLRVKETPKRESWMLELPTNSKAFGLGPRQFSKQTEMSTKDKDRSGWTQIQGKDTSESLKEKDDQDQEVLEYMASLQKDANMEKLSKELNKKRGSESLMDLHQKKLKKQKKEKDSNEEIERRPFDRDLDLQANRFDNAIKERLSKQSRTLSDKFSSGSSKYL